MGAGEEGAKGVEDGGPEGGARGSIFNYGTGEVSKCPKQCFQIPCWRLGESTGQ